MDRFSPNETHLHGRRSSPAVVLQRLRSGLILLVVVAVVGALLMACSDSSWKASGLAGAFRPVPNGAYVIDGSDRVEVDGIVRLLRTLGRQSEVVSDIDPAAVGTGIIWIPESARNDRAVATKAVTALRKGARLVMAGPSDAAVEIGLSFGPEKVKISGERYAASPDLKVTWNQPRTTWKVRDPRNDYVAATSTDGKSPVAIAGSVDAGSFLWMAVGAGTGAAERFPLLPMMFRDLLGVGPSPLWRQGIDLYVDPGSLPGADPQKLADQWLAEGVRRVYLAGWEFGFQTGNADYDAYIGAAHSRGIAAYLWLEPPVVNDRFYSEHPECHERTATGKEAVGDWRKLIALEDPTCFDQAVSSYQQIVSAHDWDGVDIAELYFEAPLSGPNRPDLYTPMSKWVRSDFHSRYGYDPSQLFNPQSKRYYKKSASSLKQFVGYRKSLVTDLHRQLVQALGSRLPVVVTTIDDKLAPDTASNVGVDVTSLQKLAATEKFQLQYEDPFTAWTQGPRRYDIAHTRYPADTVFDINDVPRPGGRPTATPTGSELLVTVAAASGQVGEVALYGEGTIPAVDTKWLPGAMAAQASLEPDAAFGTTGQVVRVKTPFTVRVPGPSGTRSATVDGRPWPLVDSQGAAMITAGSHVLAFSPWPAPVLGVRSCSCDVQIARYEGSSILAYYTSSSRGWLLLDRAPSRITVDGQALPIKVEPEGGGFLVQLPAGNHTFVAN